MYTRMTCLILALFLAGCGGGGGGGENGAAQSPAGYWSTTDGGALITRSGELWGIVVSNDGLDLLTGSFSVFGNTASGPLTLYQGSSAYTANVNLSFVPKQTLTVSTTANGVTTSESLFYDAIYEQAPSMSFVQGTWKGSKGETMTVAPNGAAVLSSSDGCQATGSITPSPTGENFYRITITTGSAPCSAVGLKIDGIVAPGTPSSVIVGLKAGQIGGAYRFSRQ